MKASLQWALVVGLLVAGAGAALAAPPAEASGAGQDTADLEALLGESVVTTASRSAERASAAPATVFNITAEEIQQTGMRTVDEALEFLGLGIFVSRPRDYGTGIDVGAQGLLFRDAGRHVLVLLDGMILNSQGTGRISLHEALGVPLDLIDHVEVMLGPGSVIYGSHAMLAVINVVTRRARDLGRLRVSAELGVSSPQDKDGVPSNDPGSRLGLRYRLSVGGGARFQLGRREGEVTAMLDWIQEESATYAVAPFPGGDFNNASFWPGQERWGGQASHGTRVPSGALTLRLGDFRLLASGFYYTRGMPLVGTFNDPFAREEQAGARIDLSHSWQLTGKLRLGTRLYGGYAAFSERSNWGEDFWCLPGQQGCHFEMSARSGWIGLEQTLNIDWLQSGKLLSLVGYDLRPRFFDSTPAAYTDLRTGQISESVPLPQVRDTSFIGAVFVQQIWQALRWLTINVGGRLDFDSIVGARFSPRAAVVLTPGSTTTVRLSYNEAFRAPSLYEHSEFDPTYRITPEALRAETVRSAEVELQQRLARLQLSLRGYASFYDDLIESRSATDDEVARVADRLSPTVDPQFVEVNDNIQSLKVFGGSLSAQLRLPAGFLLGGTFNIARAYQASWELWERMPLFHGNFRAGWSGEGGYSVSLVGVYAGEQQILDGVLPQGYFLGPRLDLRLAAAGPLRQFPGLRWRAALGFKLNPEQPFQIAGGIDTERGYVLYPAEPRLFGFVGLQYTYGGP